MLLGEATQLSLGWFQAQDAGNFDFTGSADEGTLGQASLAHRFDGGANLRLGLSALEESEAFLGSESDGAFGAGGDSRSFFATLGRQPADRRDLRAAGQLYTMGTTSMAFDNERHPERLEHRSRSNAFGVGAVAKSVLRPGRQVSACSLVSRCGSTMPTQP